MTIVKPKQKRRNKNGDWAEEVEKYYKSGLFENEREALSDSTESSDFAATDQVVFRLIRETVNRRKKRWRCRVNPVYALLSVACFAVIFYVSMNYVILVGKAALGRNDMDMESDDENMISISIVDEGLTDNYSIEVPKGYELIIDKISYKKFMDKSTGKIFELYYGNMSWITGFFTEDIKSFSIEIVKDKKIFHFYSGQTCYTFYGPKNDIAFLAKSSDLSYEELGNIISSVSLH